MATARSIFFEEYAKDLAYFSKFHQGRGLRHEVHCGADLAIRELSSVE